MCNACGNYCCGSDEFGGCGCEFCPCEACWPDDADEHEPWEPDLDDLAPDIVEIGDATIEILRSESPTGTPLFHVEHWPGFPDLWLYRTDAGDLRNVAPLRDLTPARLAPVARAIEENLEDAA